MKQELSLKSGARVVTEVIEDGDGEIVTHYVIGANGVKGTKTCTCTCSGKSTSKTCDASSDPTCNCTPDPSLSC